MRSLVSERLTELACVKLNRVLVKNCYEKIEEHSIYNNDNDLILQIVTCNTKYNKFTL